MLFLTDVFINKMYFVRSIYGRVVRFKKRYR